MAPKRICMKAEGEGTGTDPKLLCGRFSTQVGERGKRGGRVVPDVDGRLAGVEKGLEERRGREVF